CFLYPVSLRDLPSFPTRRSSDLAGLAKEKVIVSGDFRQLPPIVPTDEESILAELATDVFGRAGITNAVNSGARPKRTVMLEHQSDRKSTRLNSSHVAISYAVFCL